MAPQQQPTLPPDRALRELTKQLEQLQNFKHRSYEEARPEEREWEQYTKAIIEAAFGNPSSTLNHFHGAIHAGYHNMNGVTERQMQLNLEARIDRNESVLRAAISTLKLQLPEEAIQGAYQPGEAYAFYRDLSSLFKAAQQEVFIVDAYLDKNLFDLYVGDLSSAPKLRILSNNITASVQTVATMYAQKRPLQVRTSSDAHDRHVFIDRQGWIIGQSIKKAACNKPTYLVELTEPMLSACKGIYETLWQKAAVII